MRKREVVEKVLAIKADNNRKKRLQKQAERLYDQLADKYEADDDLIYEIAERLEGA